MKMSDSDMRDMAGMNNDGTAHAMLSMEDRKMDMGPHMKMTTLRELKPGDQEKADQVVAAARKAAEKYTDYKVALADGYKIFLPNLPQKQYHFTNYRYAFEAAIQFNPEHPTSLLYEKHGDDYKLIGVMYTAPKNSNWNDLDQRIPLSIAQWHAHINMCLPPADRKNEAWGPNAKFGLAGSITTKDGLRCRRRKVHASDIRLDGACVSRSSRSRKTSGRSSARHTITRITSTDFSREALPTNPSLTRKLKMEHTHHRIRSCM